MGVSHLAERLIYLRSLQKSLGAPMEGSALYLCFGRFFVSDTYAIFAHMVYQIPPADGPYFAYARNSMTQYHIYG